MKALADRIVDAEMLANRNLADANEASESGFQAKADALYGKAQFWLDRYNHLSGRSDREAPKA